MPFVIDERYETGHRLGGGAFGDVYLARDLQTGRDVAIKIATSSSAQVSESAIQEAFGREESALSHVRHRNVVSLLNAGRQGKRQFLVLEYIQGRSLWSVFKDEQAHPTLSTEAKLRILCGVARALGATHSNGFVHLDVKPENVLVTTDGRVVLIDFGSSLTLAQAHSRPAEIETGAYCAPEQIPGTPWCNDAGLTPRTDVFAFGIVAWELLSLHRPFGDATAGYLQRIANDSPHGSLCHLVPDCPAEVANVIGICLSKNPMNRYSSMGLVAERIESAGALLTSQIALQAAEALYRDGQTDAALQKAEEAIAASADLQKARDLAYVCSRKLIESLLKNGKTAEARESVQRAKDHCSNSPERIAQIQELEKEVNGRIYVDNQMRSLIARATKDRDTGNLSAASEYISMAAKLDASHPLLQDYYRSQQLQNVEIEQALRLSDYLAALTVWKELYGKAVAAKVSTESISDLKRLQKKIWKQAESELAQAALERRFNDAVALTTLLSSFGASDPESQPLAERLVHLLDEHTARYTSSVCTDAQSLKSRGRYEEAHALIGRALEVLPADASLLCMETELAQAEAMARELAETVQREVAAGASERARALIAQHRRSASVPASLLDELRHFVEHEGEIISSLSQIQGFAESCEFSKALELARQAFLEHPDDARFPQIVREQVGKAIGVAQTACSRGDFLAARSILESCRSSIGDDPELVDALIEVEDERLAFASEVVRSVLENARALIHAEQCDAALGCLQQIEALGESVSPELRAEVARVREQATEAIAVPNSPKPRREDFSGRGAASKTGQQRQPVSPAEPQRHGSGSTPWWRNQAVVAVAASLLMTVGGAIYFQRHNTLPPPQPGYIAIDARPWGTVKSITSLDGKLQRTVNQLTPWHDEVPVGEYRVVIADPNGHEHSERVRASTTPANPNDVFIKDFEDPDVSTTAPSR